MVGKITPQSSRLNVSSLSEPLSVSLYKKSENGVSCIARIKKIFGNV
jgi:hypothetical protein